ncbi:Regulator of chromosome condensation (RCC1) repeat-containing protein [Eubacterium barkeri]|uniref:Regulator of chromosome condensation (RCC1) repeat-containing protein n=2 Tax=Eubacterium barkeri TaxID=1528 RepID=A0A1H3HIQ0_EUBBA|nr:Regulator of chromosome condensation (RCC1) repeat-containing protein [Eubacterium barkeri]
MWGDNGDGELGDATTTDQHVPTRIIDDVASVSLGEFHSAAIKTDGSLWMWGWNREGQLGDGTRTNRVVPTKIMDNVESVSLSLSHSATIKTDGSLWMWGYNSNGELGDGTTTDRLVPTKIIDNVASVSLGGASFAAIKKDGSLWMWGRNKYGQLGDGTTTERHIPTKIIDGSATDTQYHLTFQDASTGTALSSVAATYDGQTVTSDGNGLLTLKAGDILYAPITFTKSGYQDKTITVKDLKAYENNTIQLEQTPSETPESELNLNLGTTTVDGPTVSLGDWGELPIFSMDMGMDLGNIKSKKKVDAEKKTITYQFGVEGSSDESTYQNIKTLYNLAGKSTDAAFYNKYREIQSSLKSQDIKMGVDLKGSVIGYMKYSYASGKMELEESGMLVVAGASVDFKQGIPQTANLCYVKLKITGEFNGQIQMKVVDSNINDPQMLANLSLALGIKVGVGAGLEGIAYAEGGLEGKFKVGVSLHEQTEDNPNTLESALSATISAGLYVKASLLGFWETDQSMTLAEWQLYPQTNALSLMSLNDYDSYHLPDRDYLYGLSTMALDGDNIAFSQSSVYPYGNPKIVTLADGRLMALWIGDNGEKSSANRTTLMYTIRDTAGKWSEAKAVANSERAELTPVVAVDGNTVHVLWQNGAEVFPDNITMTEMLSKMNLVYSHFDDTGFSAPVTVSTEGSGKLQQLAAMDASNGKVMVSWIENSTNDSYLANGTNSLISRSLSDGIWSDAKVLNTNVGYVTSTVVDSENQLVYYSVDADPTTEGNESICTMALDGTSTDLGAGTTLKAIDGTGYAINNGTLWTLADGALTDTGAFCTTNYDMVGQTLLFTQKTGFKNEVYTTTKDGNGTWSTAVPLTAYNSFLRYFDATADANGNIILAMDKVGVNDAYDGTAGTSPYGNTDFIITSAEDRYDLAVGETLYYDTTALAAGATINVTAEVTNTSTQAIESLKLTWLDANDQEMGPAITKSQSIGIGETAEVTTTYTLPNPLSHQTMKLRVEAATITEDSLDNNTATMEYGFSDVALESGNLTKNTDGTGTITVTVKNTGIDNAEGVTVDLYKDGTSGTKLSQQVIGNIDAGQSKNLTYALSKEQMTCADEYDGKLFYLDAKTTSVESDYANNTNELLVDPVVATEIALDQEAVTLTAGDTAQLQATLKPADAVSTTHWVSDDTTVATVDDTGKITAVAPGTATITAIASDATKQCVVTVKPIPVARLYSRTLTLEGNIGINFYMELDSSIDPATIYLKYWKDGQESQAERIPYDATFYKEKDGKKYYGFTVLVVAKEMADTINAKPVVMVDGKETQTGDTFNYSVKTYATNMLASTTASDGLKALLVPMLNYGASAQQYFTYNTTAFANADLSDAQKAIPAVTLGEEYAGAITSGTVQNPKASIYSNSLILESATALRYYIDLNEGVDPSNITLALRRKGTQDTYTQLPLTPYNGNRYYAEITNIPAKALGNMMEAQVMENGEPISEMKTYGPMAYAKNKIIQNTNASLVTLMQAMVEYNSKAKAYFNYN